MRSVEGMSERGQRLISGLLFLGACILVFRAYSMLAGGAREVLVGWVYTLLVAELIIDLIALVVLARWFALCTSAARERAIRVTVLVVVLHAIRVGIFAIGRIGPWMDFDVRPEMRASHAERWTWGDVWFASALSIASVVILIWYWRRSQTRSR